MNHIQADVVVAPLMTAYGPTLECGAPGARRTSLERRFPEALDVGGAACRRSRGKYG
jgi:hypothetical protein